MDTPQNRRVWWLIVGVASLACLFVPLSIWGLGVEYTYTLRTVALGGVVLGALSGVLGCFAVLRQESLIGDVLSHAALPGVAVAFLLAGRELGALLLGAGVASGLGVYAMNAITRTTRLKREPAMGVVLVLWFALGLALLSYVQSLPNASQAGLSTFIFGQAAAMVAQDVQWLAGMSAIVFVVLAVFWKEFKLLTFDPDFARANGFAVGFFSALLATLIVAAIVLGLQLAGVVLMVGLLIAPATAARQWTHRLSQMVVLAGVFGAFAGGVGAVLSAVDAKLPTGPMIIVVAFGVVLLSLLFAPERGVLAVLLRRRAERLRLGKLVLLPKRSGDVRA